jgi:predicted RecA/RadA family phage recombinase
LWLRYTQYCHGADVEIATAGVFDLPKAPAAVFTAGQRVSWDNIAKHVVAPATGMYPIGTALLAVGNGVAVARVRLDGGLVLRRGNDWKNSEGQLTC